MEKHAQPAEARRELPGGRDRQHYSQHNSTAVVLVQSCHARPIFTDVLSYAAYLRVLGDNRESRRAKGSAGLVCVG
jgi:hypothetical protein